MADNPPILSGVPPAILQELRQRYGEPQRVYHGWAHVEALLALFAEVRPKLHDPQAVLYATLFHDAVYNPRRDDNEERSANLLTARAAGLLDRTSLDRTVRLVLATKGHALPKGVGAEERADAALFLDMDLSILGADAARFDAYEHDVRAEYAHVPDDQFRAARTRILAAFQGREQLYLSDWGRVRFEGQARRNIARSLAASGPLV